MLASKAGMYMTAALLTIDGGRTQVSTPVACNDGVALITQTASIHDGLRIPEELYTFDDI